MMPVEVDKITVEDLPRQPTNYLVRIAQATTDQAVMKELASNAEAIVRGALLKNPQIPAELRDKLGEDPSPHVQAILRELPPSVEVLKTIEGVRSNIGVKEE